MAAAGRRPRPASLPRPNGNSANPAFPILAGQSWRYIYIQLKDFKEGRRSDPAMSPMAADLSRDDMIALAIFARRSAPIAFKATRRSKRRKISDAVLCPMCHSRRLRRPERDPTVAGQYPSTSGSSCRISRPNGAPTTPATSRSRSVCPAPLSDRRLPERQRREHARADRATSQITGHCIAPAFPERCAPFALEVTISCESSARPARCPGGTRAKSLYFDPAKCSGCLRCEMACSLLTGGAPGSSVRFAVEP